MLVSVLKDFEYSHDGVRSKRVKAGETVEVRNELIPGLSADGFVGPATGKAKPARPAAAPDAELTSEQIAAAAEKEAADKAAADKAAADEAAAAAALAGAAGGKGK